MTAIVVTAWMKFFFKVGFLVVFLFSLIRTGTQRWRTLGWAKPRAGSRWTHEWVLWIGMRRRKIGKKDEKKLWLLDVFSFSVSFLFFLWPLIISFVGYCCFSFGSLVSDYIGTFFFFSSSPAGVHQRFSYKAAHIRPKPIPIPLASCCGNWLRIRFRTLAWVRFRLWKSKIQQRCLHCLMEFRKIINNWLR